MTTKERRLVPRHNLRVPLRFRTITKPASPEQKAESLNISKRGVYFATDFPLKVGTPVELFLKMPMEVTGKAPTDLRCTARVVHLERNKFVGKTGIGVHIEQLEAQVGVERWAS